MDTFINSENSIIDLAIGFFFVWIVVVATVLLRQPLDWLFKNLQFDSLPASDMTIGA